MISHGRRKVCDILNESRNIGNADESEKYIGYKSFHAKSELVDDARFHQGIQAALRPVFENENVRA